MKRTRKWSRSHLVVADVGEDGIANHSHAAIEQLCLLAKLDGANTDALPRVAKAPAQSQNP